LRSSLTAFHVKQRVPTTPNKKRETNPNLAERHKDCGAEADCCRVLTSSETVGVDCSLTTAPPLEADNFTRNASLGSWVPSSVIATGVQMVKESPLPVGAASTIAVDGADSDGFRSTSLKVG
jgi:hypothetical protein